METLFANWRDRSGYKRQRQGGKTVIKHWLSWLDAKKDYPFTALMGIFLLTSRHKLVQINITCSKLLGYVCISKCKSHLKVCVSHNGC